MKQVLQESIFLLGVGMIPDLLGSSVRSEAFMFSYSDFQSLRPQYAESSWRGAMAKALAQKWVVKRVRDQKTVFQLSQSGRDLLASLFTQVLLGMQASSSWSLVVVKSQSGVKPEYGALQKLMKERGLLALNPGLYVLPTESLDQIFLRTLESYGFFSSVMRISPQVSLGHSLESLLEDESRMLSNARKRQQFGRESLELLSNLEKEKVLTEKQKQKIGGQVLSGLSFLQDISWPELIDPQAKLEVISLAESYKDLVQLFISR